MPVRPVGELHGTVQEAGLVDGADRLCIPEGRDLDDLDVRQPAQAPDRRPQGHLALAQIEPRPTKALTMAESLIPDYCERTWRPGS